MQKFLLKTFVLCILVLGIIKVPDYFYKQSNHYVNDIVSRETVKFGISTKANSMAEAIKFTPMENEIQIANFGSSHGRASFNYDAIPEYNTFNFGLSSQSFAYDAILLDYYKDSISDEAIVIFPISYFTLYHDDTVDEEMFERLNIRYYDILPVYYIREVDLGYYITNKISPLLWFAPNELFTEVMASDETVNVYNAKWYNTISDVETEEFTNVINRTFDNHISIIAEQKVTVSATEAYQKIISICDKENFTPVFVTTPYLDEYNLKYNDEFYSKFYDDINKLIGEDNVLYLDYSHDDRFTYNKDYFSDADHLNEIGAAEFTKVVFDDILQVQNN